MQWFAREISRLPDVAMPTAIFNVVNDTSRGRSGFWGIAGLMTTEQGESGVVLIEGSYCTSMAKFE